MESVFLPSGYRGPINSRPRASIRSKTVRSRSGSTSFVSVDPKTVFRSPAARIRCVPGSIFPINVERSERIRCVDASEYPAHHFVSTETCGLNQRAYIEIAKKGSQLTGITRAAAMVPMSLTTISSGAAALKQGRTRLNHSTLTRSDSLTTNGQRSKSSRSLHWSLLIWVPVSIRESRSEGTLPAS